MQRLLVILCKKLNKVEIEFIGKTPYIYINIYTYIYTHTQKHYNKICSRLISPTPGEHPRTAMKPCISTLCIYHCLCTRGKQTNCPYPKSRYLTLRPQAFLQLDLSHFFLTQFEGQLSPLPSQMSSLGRGKLQYLQCCLFTENCLSMTLWLIHTMRSRGANIM